MKRMVIASNPGSGLTRKSFWELKSQNTKPYLVVLTVFLFLGSLLNYLSTIVDTSALIIKGQPPSIYMPILGFFVSAAVWSRCTAFTTRSAGTLWILIGFGAAWIVHIVLALAANEALFHSIWFYLPVLALLIIKTPSWEDALFAVWVLAWLVASAMVLTLVAESVGIFPRYFVSQEILDWEKTRYWVPLDGFLGLDGRWPGPFGYNSKTGFVAAFVLTMAFAGKRKSDVFLGLIGLFFILATASRGSFLAAAAGVFAVFAFSRSGIFAWIPIKLRWITAGISVSAIGALFLFGGTQLTGRFGESGIWSGYIDLWLTSPWIGVGQVGISQADGIVAQSQAAHSMYIQELANYGIIGFTVQYAVVVAALIFMTLAAVRGFALPLAVSSAYLVASLTEILNNGWLAHSIYVLLFILLAIVAIQWLDGQGSRHTSESNSQNCD